MISQSKERTEILAAFQIVLGIVCGNRQTFGGAIQHTETKLSIPLFLIAGLDWGAGPGLSVPASTRTTRARISPARSHSPQGILARMVSPMLYISADSKRAPAREMSCVIDSSGHGEPATRTNMGIAKVMREQLRRSWLLGRSPFRGGNSSCSETSYPRCEFCSTRTTRAGVSGCAAAERFESNGNVTQTREPISQDSLRGTRTPSREASIVRVISMRMPSGPRQRIRVGIPNWARGCLRISTKVLALS